MDVRAKATLIGSMILLVSTFIFVDKIGERFNVKFEDLTRKRLMFGFIKDWKGPSKLLLNHLILMFKRYIYTQKCKNTTPCLTGLISFIQNTKDIELNIAKKKN